MVLKLLKSHSFYRYAHACPCLASKYTATEKDFFSHSLVKFAVQTSIVASS